MGNTAETIERTTASRPDICYCMYRTYLIVYINSHQKVIMAVRKIEREENVLH